MHTHTTTIEFDTVRTRLADLALSEAAKEKARTLTPFLREAELTGRMAETTGARTVLDGLGTPPVSPMESTAETRATRRTWLNALPRAAQRHQRVPDHLLAHAVVSEEG